MSDLFGPEGTELLGHLTVPARYGACVQSLKRRIENLEDEIDLFADSPAAGWSPTSRGSPSPDSWRRGPV
jgi:hypothetical protein